MPSSRPQSPSEHIDVLEMNEAFEEVDGSFEFTGTLLVYKAGGDLHHAVSKARYSSPSEVKVEHLNNDVLIPVSAYSPLFPPGFTRCTRAPATKLSHQKASADILRSNSPRVPAESDRRVRSLRSCSLRVSEAASAPQHCHIPRLPGFRWENNWSLLCGIPAYPNARSQPARSYEKDYSSLLAGIESGIKHLHALGLVHNDINPSNIMLDGDEAVIIAFGSCRPAGESLEGVGRTYEWYDEQVETALPQNDLDALEEIRIWLGDNSKPFQFVE
ncbi:uncharacterized protein P884DRAFT_18555 [Thermothelomyces heterothallicus CBS 202.75]|uniref:uncharacterized protein n=1 Tax=Thermothelomyces heterothallicus CBS 202.75 TaxID=1149848 RepID=UPI003742ABFF